MSSDLNKKAQKLNAQTIACRVASDVLADLLWSNNLQFSYMSNRYATDYEKTEFGREIQRIVSSLRSLQWRREKRLSGLMQQDESQ
jgi:hypothetical protein